MIYKEMPGRDKMKRKESATYTRVTVSSCPDCVRRQKGYGGTAARNRDRIRGKGETFSRHQITSHSQLPLAWGIRSWTPLDSGHQRSHSLVEICAVLRRPGRGSHSERQLRDGDLLWNWMLLPHRANAGPLRRSWPCPSATSCPSLLAVDLRVCTLLTSFAVPRLVAVVLS